MNDPSQLSLRYLLQAVRLRRAVALAVAAPLFAALAAYIFSLQPQYTSAAVVLLAPTAEELTDPAAGHVTAMTDPFFIRSETAILSSDGLSRAVIEHLRLWKLPEFQPKPGLAKRLGLGGHKTAKSGLSAREILLDQVTRQYQDQLYVFNDGRSNTVEIDFTAEDPREAAAVANAHAEAYLLQQSTRRHETQQKAIEWLAREVDARAAEVRAADAEVQQYRLKSDIVSTNDATIVEQRLSQLNTQLVEARRQLSTQNAMLAGIGQIRAGGDAANAGILLNDGALQSLLQRRVDAQASLAALEKRLASKHPALVRQRQELASINNVLNDQLQRLQSEAASSAAAWQAQVSDLSRAVDAETLSKVKQDRVAAGLPALTAQAQVKRAVFETVLNRYQTLLAEKGFVAPAASIVSRAEPSGRPSYPKTGLLLLIAAMGSALAGMLAAIAVQLRKSTSMGLVAVADAVGIRPLAAIPRFSNASRVDGVIQIKDPRLYIESLRFLRDAVLDRQQNREGTICLVTSVLPRQGKSLVAMSLARSIARAERRTLFLELDLRQPSGSALARREPPQQGVAAMLQGRASLAEVIVRDEKTPLDMLLAERGASCALDLLTTAELRKLLAGLCRHYDAIIIDSPPVGIVSDALTLVPLVDQTLLVARDGDTSIAELRRGARLLHERGATSLGLVLTSIDPDDLSSVDKKILHRYVTGVSAMVPGDLRGKRRAGP